MPYQGDNLISVKRGNRSAALGILHEKGAMSRKRLAEHMNLTPAAITKIVGEMLEEGLLLEGEVLQSSGAGRREIPEAGHRLGGAPGRQRGLFGGEQTGGEGGCG